MNVLHLKVHFMNYRIEETETIRQIIPPGNRRYNTGGYNAYYGYYGRENGFLV